MRRERDAYEGILPRATLCMQTRQREKKKNDLSFSKKKLVQEEEMENRLNIGLACGHR